MNQKSIAKKVNAMREILYKNITSPKNKRRVISVSDRSENKNVLTHVHRTFIYMVTQEVKVAEELPAPLFFITKYYNTKTKEERFVFRVKGVFYVIKETSYLLIHFCHSLRIDIVRKPKDSVCS